MSVLIDHPNIGKIVRDLVDGVSFKWRQENVATASEQPKNESALFANAFMQHEDVYRFMLDYPNLLIRVISISDTHDMVREGLHLDVPPHWIDADLLYNIIDSGVVSHSFLSIGGCYYDSDLPRGTRIAFDLPVMKSQITAVQDAFKADAEAKAATPPKGDNVICIRSKLRH